MNRDQITHYLPLVKLLFVGFFVGSIIVGGLTLNAVLLTLLVAALLLLSRADVLQAVLAVVVGAVLIVLFPQLSFVKLDTDVLVACIAIVLLL